MPAHWLVEASSELCLGKSWRMVPLTLFVVVAVVLKEEEDSVPDTVAVSDSVGPAAAVTAPVMLIDHVWPAPRLAAVHVTWGDE